MATVRIQEESIIGGIQSYEYFGAAGQYLSAIAINPEFPKDDSSLKACGLLRPTSMAKFSGSTITGVPLWIETNPKTQNIYIYASDGKLHEASSSLSMNSDIGTLSSASGNGLSYHDNKMVAAKNTDIAAYKPMDGTPSLTTSYWVGTLGKTALTNTTYPAINGVTIPNHPMYRHTDGRLYIGDVVSGKGALHFIKTTKTTVEGDTDDGSTYNALDFPYGYYPSAINGLDTRVVTALFEGTGTTTRQKPAKLAFWDGISTSYLQIIDYEFDDPIITGLRNINGWLYVVSGNYSGGCRVARYVGGYSFEEVAYLEDSFPPLPGAVDAILDQVLFGGLVTEPATAAVVHSVGTKLPGARGVGPTFPHHVPFRASASGSNPMVTALKFVEQANNAKMRPIIGWTDGSGKGVDKLSTTYGTAYINFPKKRLGMRGNIKKVIIPLVQAVAANMTLVAKIYVDGATSGTTIATINSTNYPNSERIITIYPNIEFEHEYRLELIWSGTALLTVALPITYEIQPETSA